MRTLNLMIYLTALLLLPLVACEREEPSLSLDLPSFEVQAEGGSQTVVVTCNYGWTATASDPWIHLSPSSGSRGQTSVTIKVDANDGDLARRGSASFICRGVSRAVSVSQSPNLNQLLVIEHQNTSFRIPVLSGNGVSGVVDWGDGQEEFYNSSLNHSYHSVGNHTVSIKASGAASFDLERVTGVSVIDFEKF